MSFKTQISQKIVSLVFSILVVCFGIGFYVFAWTGPTEAPPGGNVPAPLNTGKDAQTKLGPLFLNTSLFPGEPGFVVAQGNVGIGTFSPQTDLEVNNTLRLSPTDSPNYAVEGALYYNDSNNIIMYHDGSDWQPILAGASSTVYITTTRGAFSSLAAGGSYPPPYCPTGWSIVESWTYWIRTSGYPSGNYYNDFRETLCSK